MPSDSTSASKVASMAGPAINGSPSGTKPSSSAMLLVLADIQIARRECEQDEPTGDLKIRDRDCERGKNELPEKHETDADSANFDPPESPALL
jgi:hypothetical protein